MNTHNFSPQEDPEFKEIWDLTGQYQYKSEVDTEDALTKFLADRNQTQKPTLTVVHSTKRWLSIAAAVAVLVTGSFLLWNKIQSTKNLLTVGVRLTQSNEIKTETLEDGTVVTLNKNSKISWEFNGNQRKVTLTGMAHFEVARDEAKPFIIEGQQGSVKVLGTGFDVISYPNKQQKVIVHHGKVEVKSKFELKGKSNTAILTKNMKAVIDVDGSAVAISQITDANSIQWADGKLVFKNTPLPDVIEAMEIFYGTTIEIPGNSPELYKRNQTPKYTGKFVQGEDVELACKIISKALSTTILPAEQINTP
jgi:transmembrane sensor